MNQMNVQDTNYAPAPFISDPDSDKPRPTSEYSSSLEVMENLRKNSYQSAPLNKSLSEIKPQNPKSPYSSSLDVKMLLKKSDDETVTESKENVDDKVKKESEEKDELNENSKDNESNDKTKEDKSKDHDLNKKKNK